MSIFGDITLKPDPRALAANGEEPFKLLTFFKSKYCEQIIAIDGGGKRLNLGLFDMIEILADDDTLDARNAVKDKARIFAERFVAQMNAGL